MKVSKLASNLIGSEIIKIGNEVNDLKAKKVHKSQILQSVILILTSIIPSELKQGIESL